MLKCWYGKANYYPQSPTCHNIASSCQLPGINPSRWPEGDTSLSTTRPDDHICWAEREYGLSNSHIPINPLL